VTLRVEGTPPSGAALVVPNHFSLLDAFAVVGAHPMTVAGRADLEGLPFIGAIPRTYRLIGVERSRRTATEDFVEAVQARLAAGVPVLVFAEGTTSDGTHLLPFKTGAFEAVAGTPYPVVPVGHRPVRDRHGAVADLRPFSFHDEPMLRSFRRVAARLPAEVVVRFGDPIPAETHTRKTLATEARAAVKGLAMYDGRRAA
jgi:1-acyl-sn-glycerol-3-phosphate acyltransferase